MKPAVGYPRPDGTDACTGLDCIAVSRTDHGLMIDHVTALGDWIRAAHACLEGAQ